MLFCVGQQICHCILFCEIINFKLSHLFVIRPLFGNLFLEEGFVKEGDFRMHDVLTFGFQQFVNDVTWAVHQLPFAVLIIAFAAAFVVNRCATMALTVDTVNGNTLTRLRRRTAALSIATGSVLGIVFFASLALNLAEVALNY